MSKKAERLRVLDGLAPPELWPDIRDREPQPSPGEATQGHRALAAALACLVAIAGLGVVIVAFSGEPVPPAPATTVGNGLLAFSHEGEIYVVSPDGSGLRQLADFKEDALDVHWSPDGSKLAFLAWTKGDYELYVMNADGTGMTNITGSMGAGELAWSPDGSMIAFTSFQHGNDSDIFVVRADGTGLRPVVESPLTEHGPEWSPDGTRIAFERWPVRDRDPGTADIYMVNLETGETVPVVTSSGYDTGIAWSPDGDTLAFTSDRDGDRNLYLVGADGSGERQLTDLPNEGATTAHAWSPDGTRLSFVIGDGKQWDLWIVNADGSGLLKLTPIDRDDGPAVWSPDGSRLAFTASSVTGGIDNTGTFDVYTIRPDGTDEVRVTSGRVAMGWDLSWQAVTVGTERVEPFPKANGPIYFRVGGEGGSRIESIEPDGSGRTVVFPEDSSVHYSRISFSPDGSRIAFDNFLEGEYGIETAAPDGSDIVRLTDGVNDSWASWSPDGTRILFSSTRHDPSIEQCTPGFPHEHGCPTDVYVMDVDGSNVIRLTDDPASEYQPVWSPDGGRIAFARSLGDPQLSRPAIFTMDPDGTGVRQVSSADGGSDFWPSWSPDGSRIVFAAIRNENWGIWVVDADGSNEHQIFGGVGTGYVNNPVWSPDGSLIAFVGNPSVDDYSPDDALYVMRPDGSGVTPLADAPGIGVAGDIAWQPLPGSAEAVELTPTPITAEVVDTFDVAIQVSSVAYGEGSVWVAASNDDGTFGGRIIRIDPQTHEVQAEIPVDVLPTWEVGGGAMVVLPGSLWVTGSLEAPGTFDAPGGGADAAVIRIDTATNEVVETYELGGTHGADLAFLNDELWVLLFGDEAVDHAMEVVRVHSTGTVLNRVSLSATWAHTIVAAGGRLVVYEGGDGATNVDGHLVSIDPETNEVDVRAEIPSRYFEGGPVVWRGQVWAALDDGFARFDPVSGEVIEGSQELDPSRFAFCCGFVEADDRGIWFIGFDGKTGGDERRLDLFDPATGEVTELVTLDGDSSPVAMALAPDGVWILNYEGTLTHVRIG